MDAKSMINYLFNPMPRYQPVKNEVTGPLTSRDIIAPPSIEVDFDFLKIGDYYFRTLFVAGYPRFVNSNWLEPLISFNHTLDIATFIYPTRSEEVLENLKRKVGEMEATIQSDFKRGKVIEPSVQVALEDALALQQELAKGSERFFQFGLYVTIPAPTLEELDKTSKQVEATLGSLLIVSKKAVLQMEEAFKTTLPMGGDKLMITRNMDTTSLASTFPFTSSELTANEGILYGINEGNESLVIFDRFTMENANMVVFGKSGSGKSYSIKLEIIRSMMFDTEVIIIDPENEYEALAKTVGGEYVKFQFGAESKINPFDLAVMKSATGESELNQKILALHGFFRVIMGTLTPSEDAVLDRALILTYKQKGITPDPETQTREPPLVEDLYKTLVGMEDQLSRGLADRIEKFVKGSMVGIFDAQTNIHINNQLTVFSIRDLEDELRPIAMFMILDFVWNRVRRNPKRRLLVVDEAWYMMRYPDSANFLNSIAKRARKYYLGVTTITQDVEDFLAVDIGRAIIQNSSIQMLLKQSASSIDKIAETFYLSEGEKHLLVAADVGEGLFFAGPAHAAIRVIASPQEHQLATTKPQEVAARDKQPAPVSKPVVPPTPPSQPLTGMQSTIVPIQPSTPKPLPVVQIPTPPQPTNRPIMTTTPVPPSPAPPMPPPAPKPSPPISGTIDLSARPPGTTNRPIFTVETVNDKQT